MLILISYSFWLLVCNGTITINVFSYNRELFIVGVIWAILIIFDIKSINFQLHYTIPYTIMAFLFGHKMNNGKGSVFLLISN